ncbi:hypothetical protein AEAC466_14875 [Asticcacaulis sp. AC466]|uniref:DUF1285 domain-containing protein n=1 Tax=Asticcacaulis sp. AC466 TaxID=1282362 RepID=UPI0003C3E590|nr:DUF1285 domain-containing protein [Asticcacaulis sp. AC466]ESQ83144.1 hypothetical protein AEAC466_14875 [Asticcacaulis sp. AC466]
MDLSRLYDDMTVQAGPPPVDTWHPPFCGDIDMVIRHDGTWHYNGTPIARHAMVQLFSRILRRDADAFFLVTPVEKVGIRVEDTPFIAVEMTETAPLTFRTNVGDIVVVGPDNALRFDTGADGFRPYVHVRGGLEARLSRDLARDLADLAHVEDGWFGVRAGGVFFPISPAETAV